MPNDAKLGLLAGVIGVIVAASLTLSRQPSGAPPPDQAAGPKQQAPADGNNLGVPPLAQTPPADPTATPVIRTKPETDATPTGRKPGNDDIDP